MCFHLLSFFGVSQSPKKEEPNSISAAEEGAVAWLRKYEEGELGLGDGCAKTGETPSKYEI